MGMKYLHTTHSNWDYFTSQPLSGSPPQKKAQDLGIKPSCSWKPVKFPGSKTWNSNVFYFARWGMATVRDPESQRCSQQMQILDPSTLKTRNPKPWMMWVTPSFQDQLLGADFNKANSTKIHGTDIFTSRFIININHSCIGKYAHGFMDGMGDDDWVSDPPPKRIVFRFAWNHSQFWWDTIPRVRCLIVLFLSGDFFFIGVDPMGDGKSPWKQNNQVIQFVTFFIP